MFYDTIIQLFHVMTQHFQQEARTVDLAFSARATVRVAQTLDVACKLIEDGLDFVTNMEGDKIFRKRK